VRFERAYYHCPHCGQGGFPGEEALQIVDHQTPAHREVVTLAGMLHPFAEGAEQVLDRLAGLRAATSTVQRTTEAVGAEVARREAEGETFQPEPAAWEWSRDAQGRSVAYISIDATSVPQQGPHREKRDGRMPNVGAIFNPAPRKQKDRRDRQLWDVHYVAGLMSLPQMSVRLRQEVNAVGLGRAQVVIGLTDGGAGLEECLLSAVSGLGNEQIVFILDIHHARDHLVEFAKEWCADEESRRDQVRLWAQRLMAEGGASLLRELESLDLSERSGSVQEGRRRLSGYVRNNLHRMDYPTYVKNGWQIGSGVIESACKTVVCRRMKQGGMRWREKGTDALCRLRSLYFSSDHRWQYFWSHLTAG
jgi:hypothetical protein